MKRTAQNVVEDAPPSLFPIGRLFKSRNEQTPASSKRSEFAECDWSISQWKTPDSLPNPRIASGLQMVHCERMSEDEIGEIRVELKAYKQKLDELREDFKFFLMHEFEATNRIIEKANQRGNPRYNQPVVERCRKYLDKYAIGGAY